MGAGHGFANLRKVERPMLPEVAGIFERHQAGQARSLQTHIGPSEVGHPCDRNLGYKLQRVPHAVPPHLKWAALVGTWGHSGAEQAMLEENMRLDRERYLVEKRAYIEEDLVPSGSTDVYDTDFDEVIDWKFVGESSAKKYRNTGGSRLYIVQAMLYGLGWLRMGRVPKSIRIIFLPRWSNNIDDGVEVAYEFDEQIALDALDRLRMIRAASNAVAGGLAPWTEIEADKSDCRFCPWLTRKRSDEPEADETGCNGYHKRDDLAQLGGVPLARDVETTPAERLAHLIGVAQHPDALAGLWREAHDPAACRCRSLAPCGRWLPSHSRLAAERRAALASGAAHGS